MGVRMVIMIATDWSLTWLNALIVTDWDDTDWEGVPDIIPVDWLRDRPMGRDPDVIENESWSPLIVGVMENSLSFVRTKEDWEYENEVMDWRIVNERESDRSLTSFEALIVTDWDIMDREGEPDMIPVVELSDNPIGSDPDETVKESWSPLIEGMIENDSFFDRT